MIIPQSMTAEDYIHHLQLNPHPEGGYYKQTYRSEEIINSSCLPKRFAGDRRFSTAIYYLLQQGDFSAFHRFKSDECWHFYAGQTLLIHVIEIDGSYYCVKLGDQIQNNEVFQYVVPAEAWLAVEPASATKFALAGCTVAPGFDFADFEMADKEDLLRKFPQQVSTIIRLCKKSIR